MGRAAEPVEDRAVVVQRRKKQRLQVRQGAALASAQLCFCTCSLLAAFSCLRHADCLLGAVGHAA